MGGYLIWYGIVRCITETLRSKSGANEVLMVGPIKVSILVSIIFIVCGIAFLIIKRFFGKRELYQDIIENVKMNKIDTILFDLDGTVLNTKRLIDQSFIHTFAKFYPDYKLTDEELDSFFGPTLRETFSRYSNDEKQIQEMMDYYKEFNVKNHTKEYIEPYDGVKDTLKFLKKRAISLGLYPQRERK